MSSVLGNKRRLGEFLVILIHVGTILMGTTQGQGQGQSQRGNPTRPGRHVCVDKRRVQTPVQISQTYCKPVYRKHVHRCEGYNRMCTSFRVVYELAYRKVVKMRTHTQRTYVCCPGWTQRAANENGCRQAICRQPCLNRGRCVRPDVCVCAKGWTGQFCQAALKRIPSKTRTRTDPQTVPRSTTPKPERKPSKIPTRTTSRKVSKRFKSRTVSSEISGKQVCSVGAHPCDHRCVPAPPSYRCECYEGFALQSDKTSCKLCLTCLSDYTDLQEGYNKLLEKVTSLEADKEEMFGNITKISREYSDTIVQLRNDMNTLSHLPANTAPEEPQDPEEGGVPWERIYSLSEQIGLLEERLEVCTCGGGTQAQTRAVGVPGE